MGYLLILGAGSKDGSDLAREYASSGYDLYLADKDLDKLQEISKNISESYEIDVQILKFEVSEFYEHRNLYNGLNPKPEGVICAVDYPGDKLKAQKDFLEAKKIMDTNYTGLVSILNIVANDFEERKSGFIQAVIKGEHDLSVYNSARMGLTVYLRGLKSRLSEVGVDVSTIGHNDPEPKPKGIGAVFKSLLWK